MTNACLWRRLDVPGHDACRLVGDGAGWHLTGAAVFRHRGAVAQLAYRVSCGRAWRAYGGRVEGWLGDEAVEIDVVRTGPGAWTVGGEAVPGVGDCLDLDLGFTPATNLLAIRRLALAVGEAAEAPAVWLDLETGRLERLPQRYERRSETAYWYEAPSTGYADLLEVAPSGFVVRYPGLWEAER